MLEDSGEYKAKTTHTGGRSPTRRVGHLQLNDWLASHDMEQQEEAFSSVAVYSELRMRETIERTCGMSRPNRERTAVAIDILFKMSNLFGRFSGLMRLVADEVVSSTYATMDDRQTGDAIPSRKLIEAASPYFLLWRQAQSDLRASHERLKASQANGEAIHFQRATDLVAQLSKVDKRMLQKHTFDAWHGYCRKQAVRVRQLRSRATLRCAGRWYKKWRQTKEDEDAAEHEGSWYDHYKDVELELDYLHKMNESLMREAAEMHKLLGLQEKAPSDLAKLLDSLCALMKTHKEADATRKSASHQVGGASAPVLSRLPSFVLIERPSLKARSSVRESAAKRATMSRVEVGVQTGTSTSCTVETQTDQLVNATMIGAGAAKGRQSAFFCGGDTRRGTMRTSIMHDGGAHFATGLGELIEGGSKKGSKKPSKEISIQLANALIVNIYEAKLKQDGDDIIQGRPHQSMPELARDLLIRKYGIKRLATKTLKSLIALCKKQGSATPRLRLFASLCAIPTDEHKHVSYSLVKVSLFSTLFAYLFKSAKDVGLAMGSKQLGIDRDVVMAAFASTFTTIRKRNAKEYKQTARALLMLPSERVVTMVEGCLTKQTLINVDNALEHMMMAWEAEHRYRSASIFSTLNKQETDVGSTGNSTSPKKPTAKQTTLISNLIATKIARQRDIKRQQAVQIEGLFRDVDREMNTGTEQGELSVPNFNEVLERLDLRLDNREVMELFNEWEDQCEADEEERSSFDEDEGLNQQLSRAKVFATVVLSRGLFRPKDISRDAATVF